MSLDFFLSLRNYIFQFFLNFVKGNANLCQSQLIIFSEVESILNFMGQLFSGLLQQITPVFCLSRMILKACSECTSQTFKVCLIQLSNLYLGHLDFPFIMLYDISYFSLELIIIFLDKLQSFFFINLQIFIDFQQSLGLFFLGSYDMLQNGDLALVEASEIGLSL